MFRKLLVFLFLFFYTVSLAVTGYDKFLHYSVSYTAFGLSSYFFGEPGGFLLTLSLGVGKELWDLISGQGTPELGDLAADLAGLISGYAFSRSLTFRPIVIFKIVF